MVKCVLGWLFLAVLSCSWAEELPYQQRLTQPTTCIFPGTWRPAEFVVFAAGAYSGRKIPFQIDQSGHEGTQIDVSVNYFKKPVVLMLGAYEPTIWNIRWTKFTQIIGVLVSGYHRQVVAGLDRDVPTIISTYDNRGKCGSFYVSQENLTALNPVSRRIYGRPVDMVYPAEEGKVVVGDPIPPNMWLLTSDIRPESFYNKTAPLAGQAGIDDAVRKGILRKMTLEDVKAWDDAVARKMPRRDVPPVAGGAQTTRTYPPYIGNAYVVLQPFVYPAGLFGANAVSFFIQKGVPVPTGDPGHSAVYDFNTVICRGPLCGTLF